VGSGGYYAVLVAPNYKGEQEGMYCAGRYERNNAGDEYWIYYFDESCDVTEPNLPACPFSGTPGDIWAKDSYCDWTSEAMCKVGTDCDAQCVDETYQCVGGKKHIVSTKTTYGARCVVSYRWGLAGFPCSYPERHDPSYCKLCVVK
jgi:hypothetical protein